MRLHDVNADLTWSARKSFDFPCKRLSGGMTACVCFNWQLCWEMLLSCWFPTNLYIKVDALWYDCYRVIIWFLSRENARKWYLLLSLSDIFCVIRVRKIYYRLQVLMSLMNYGTLVASWSILILICQTSFITLCGKSYDLVRKYVAFATAVSQKRKCQPIYFILDLLSNERTWY